MTFTSCQQHAPAFLAIVKSHTLEEEPDTVHHSQTELSRLRTWCTPSLLYGDKAPNEAAGRCPQVQRQAVASKTGTKPASPAVRIHHQNPRSSPRPDQSGLHLGFVKKIWVKSRTDSLNAHKC